MSCKSTSFQFYSGEDKSLELQLIQKINDCSEIFPIISASDEIKVTLIARPTDLVFLNTGVGPRVSVTSEPYGTIKIDLLSAETSQLVNGAIVIELTRAGKKKIFVVDGGIEKLTPSNC